MISINKGQRGEFKQNWAQNALPLIKMIMMTVIKILEILTHEFSAGFYWLLALRPIFLNWTLKGEMIYYHQKRESSTHQKGCPPLGNPHLIMLESVCHNIFSVKGG